MEAKRMKRGVHYWDGRRRLRLDDITGNMGRSIPAFLTLTECWFDNGKPIGTDPVHVRSRDIHRKFKDLLESTDSVDRDTVKRYRKRARECRRTGALQAQLLKALKERGVSPFSMSARHVSLRLEDVANMLMDLDKSRVAV